MNAEGKWKFPGGGWEITGLNANPLDTKTSKLDTLAKEICQNSIDAQLQKDQPVVVEFNSFEIDREKFPDFKGYCESVSKCRLFTQKSQKNDLRDVKVFEKMEELLRSKKISTLRISDFNTTGLRGSENPDEYNPWNLLTKTMGISDKMGDSGGSFGVGKRAAYEASLLRTVLYSTLDTNGIKASTGVCMWATFKDDNNTLRGPNGHYCVDENATPVHDQLFLDGSFERKESGTDVYIPAFADYAQSWISKIKLAVISSFFVAILREKLVVRINGEKIDKNNVADILIGLPKSFSDENAEEIGTTKALIDAFKSPPVIDSPDYTLHIVQNPDFGKVMGVRSNGMAIQQIPYSNGSFAGVLIVNDPEKNRILRSCETPTHNKWIPDTTKLQEEHSTAKALISEIKKLVGMQTAEMVQSEVGDREDAYGLDEYLSFEGEGDKNEDSPNKYRSENNKITDIIQTNPKRRKKIALGSKVDNVAPSDGSDKDSYADRGTGGDGTPPVNPPQPIDGPFPQTGLKPEDSGALTKIVPGSKIRLDNTRALVSNKNSSEYILYFVSSESAEFSIRIRAAGVDTIREKDDEIISIVSAFTPEGENIPCKNDMIGPIKTEKGKRYKIRFIADYPVLFSPYPEVCI